MFVRWLLRVALVHAGSQTISISLSQSPGVHVTQSPVSSPSKSQLPSLASTCVLASQSLAAVSASPEPAASSSCRTSLNWSPVSASFSSWSSSVSMSPSPSSSALVLHDLVSISLSSSLAASLPLTSASLCAAAQNDVCTLGGDASATCSDQDAETLGGYTCLCNQTRFAFTRSLYGGTCVPISLTCARRQIPLASISDHAEFSPTDCPIYGVHGDQCVLICAAGYITESAMPATCLASGQTSLSYVGASLSCARPTCNASAVLIPDGAELGKCPTVGHAQWPGESREPTTCTVTCRLGYISNTSQAGVCQQVGDAAAAYVFASPNGQPALTCHSCADVNRVLSSSAQACGSDCGNCRPGFYGTSGAAANSWLTLSDCQPCPTAAIGQYVTRECTSVSQPAFATCKAASRQDGLVAGKCGDCHEGFWGLSGAAAGTSASAITSCLPCSLPQDGEYVTQSCNSTSNAQMANCSSVFRLAGNSSGVCGDCMQGYFGSLGPWSRASGTSSSSSSSSLALCNPAACVPAYEGRVAALHATDCQVCSAGTFSTGGSAICQPVFCPQGYHPREEAGVSLSDCLICPSGKYSKGGMPNSSMCREVVCPPNHQPKPTGVAAVSAVDCNQLCTVDDCGQVNGFVYEPKTPLPVCNGSCSLAQCCHPVTALDECFNTTLCSSENGINTCMELEPPGTYRCSEGFETISFSSNTRPIHLDAVPGNYSSSCVFTNGRLCAKANSSAVRFSEDAAACWLPFQPLPPGRAYGYGVFRFIWIAPLQRVFNSLLSLVALFNLPTGHRFGLTTNAVNQFMYQVGSMVTNLRVAAEAGKSYRVTHRWSPANLVSNSVSPDTMLWGELEVGVGDNWFLLVEFPLSSWSQQIASKLGLVLSVGSCVNWVELLYTTSSLLLTCPVGSSPNQVGTACQADCPPQFLNQYAKCQDCPANSGTNPATGMADLTRGAAACVCDSGFSQVGASCIDKQPPRLVCPPAARFSTENNTLYGRGVYASPEAVGNGAVSVFLRQGFSSGSAFPLGTTIVVYEAVDQRGLTAQCSFPVVIYDGEAPTFHQRCPPFSSTGLLSDLNGQAVIPGFAGMTATDTVDGQVTAVQVQGPALNNTFPSGRSAVEWIASDTAGNPRVCSFAVTVQPRECPAGFFGQNGRALPQCYPCPRGTFQNQSSSAACLPCPLNFFSNTTGATFCFICPAGTHAPHTGSYICTPLNNCPPGSALADGLTTTSTCPFCPAGAISQQPGSKPEQCTPCPINTVPNSLHTACEACPAVKGTNGTGSALCLNLGCTDSTAENFNTSAGVLQPWDCVFSHQITCATTDAGCPGAFLRQVDSNINQIWQLTVPAGSVLGNTKLTAQLSCPAQLALLFPYNLGAALGTTGLSRQAMVFFGPNSARFAQPVQVCFRTGVKTNQEQWSILTSPDSNLQTGTFLPTIIKAIFGQSSACANLSSLAHGAVALLATPLPKLDCLTSAWSTFSDCSVSCGGGIVFRTRNVTRQPSSNGQPCGPLLEQRSCAEVPCTVDCVVTDWSPYGLCSVACGGGVEIRTRQVVPGHEPRVGGRICPMLVQERPCNTQACPALAELRQAVVSSGGVAIFLIFSAPTNMGGKLLMSQYSCDEQLENAASLGAGSVCMWTNAASTLRIRIGQLDGTVLAIAIGDAVAFKPTVNLTDFNGQVITRRSRPLSAPYPIPPPVPVITGPQKVGPCVRFVLDSASSGGSVGRNFTTRLWSKVNFNSPNGRLDPSAFSSNNRKLTLTSDSLEPKDAIHIFQLTLTNWLGGFATILYQLSVESLVLPTVVVPAHTFIAPSQELTITAVVSNEYSRVSDELNDPACAVNDEFYVWKWSQTGGKHRATLDATSASTPSLYLAAHSLLSAHSYEFTVEVYSSFTPNVKATASCQVEVRQLPLQPRIAGGSRQVSAGSILVLDASESRDPDYSGTAPDVQLRFAWSCARGTSSNSAGEQPCNLPATNPPLGAISGLSNLTIYSLESGYVYTVIMQLSKDTRTTSTSVVLSAEASALLPHVSIELTNEPGFGAGIDNWPPDRRLQLLARAAPAGSFTPEVVVQWSQLLGNVNLTNPMVTKTPLSGRGQLGVPLVLLENSLTPGATYIFAAQAADTANNTTATAVFTVTISTPPSSGACEISQASGGLAFETLLTVTCDGWSSSNFPLSYQFELQQLDANLPARLLQDYSPLPAVQGIVLGNASTPQRHLLVQIRDSAGAVTTVDLFVEVLPSPAGFQSASLRRSVNDPAARIANQLLTQNLSAALYNKDANAVYQTVHTAMEILASSPTNEADQLSVRAVVRNTALDGLATVRALVADSLSNLVQQQQAVQAVVNAPRELDTNCRALSLNLTNSLLSSQVGLAAASSVLLADSAFAILSQVAESLEMAYELSDAMRDGLAQENEMLARAVSDFPRMIMYVYGFHRSVRESSLLSAGDMYLAMEKRAGDSAEGIFYSVNSSIRLPAGLFWSGDVVISLLQQDDIYSRSPIQRTKGSRIPRTLTASMVDAVSALSLSLSPASLALVVAIPHPPIPFVTGPSDSAWSCVPASGQGAGDLHGLDRICNSLAQGSELSHSSAWNTSQCIYDFLASTELQTVCNCSMWGVYSINVEQFESEVAWPGVEPYRSIWQTATFIGLCVMVGVYLILLPIAQLRDSRERYISQAQVAKLRARWITQALHTENIWTETYSALIEEHEYIALIWQPVGASYGSVARLTLLTTLLLTFMFISAAFYGSTRVATLSIVPVALVGAAVSFFLVPFLRLGFSRSRAQLGPREKFNFDIKSLQLQRSGRGRLSDPCMLRSDLAFRWCIIISFTAAAGMLLFGMLFDRNRGDISGFNEKANTRLTGFQLQTGYLDADACRAECAADALCWGVMFRKRDCQCVLVGKGTSVMDTDWTSQLAVVSLQNDAQAWASAFALMVAFDFFLFMPLWIFLAVWLRRCCAAGHASTAEFDYDCIPLQGLEGGNLPGRGSKNGIYYGDVVGMSRQQMERRNSLPDMLVDSGRFPVAPQASYLTLLGKPLTETDTAAFFPALGLGVVTTPAPTEGANARPGSGGSVGPAPRKFSQITEGLDQRSGSLVSANGASAEVMYDQAEIKDAGDLDTDQPVELVRDLLIETSEEQPTGARLDRQLSPRFAQLSPRFRKQAQLLRREAKEAGRELEAAREAQRVAEERARMAFEAQQRAERDKEEEEKRLIVLKASRERVQAMEAAEAKRLAEAQRVAEERARMAFEAQQRAERDKEDEKRLMILKASRERVQAMEAAEAKRLAEVQAIEAKRLSEVQTMEAKRQAEAEAQARAQAKAQAEAQQEAERMLAEPVQKQADHEAALEAEHIIARVAVAKPAAKERAESAKMTERPKAAVVAISRRSLPNAAAGISPRSSFSPRSHPKEKKIKEQTTSAAGSSPRSPLEQKKTITPVERNARKTAAEASASPRELKESTQGQLRPLSGGVKSLKATKPKSQRISKLKGKFDNSSPKPVEKKKGKMCLTCTFENKPSATICDVCRESLL